ncbi:pyrophosphatase/phosphodiesterase [Ceratobasidium sp. AG-Ba]|nr:pyrophosphatase/phosphodiesterase [Ceratobasidium sp. AG-Ba]
MDKETPLPAERNHWTRGLPILIRSPGFYTMAACVLAAKIVSVLALGSFCKQKMPLIMNNGTHDFQKTVIVVSIDGFRADYLERGLTPHLLATANSGLRAQWLQPCYPVRQDPTSESRTHISLPKVLTFPNHWSMITGLYPESHGIIANYFIDPITKSRFFYQDPAQSWNASWWGGEPMWETARKAGLLTANLMWPGPPVTRDGYSASYFIPFRSDITLLQKADQIFGWLDKPFDQRPQLVNVYEPLVDEIGHTHGPDSPEMEDALSQVDSFVSRIRSGLDKRNLSSIVDVLFLSDHGMAPTHDRQWIYLDDILGEDGADDIEFRIGQPNAGLWFREGANTTLSRFTQGLTMFVWIEIPAALQNPFPLSKRFSPDHNPRIPSIWLAAELGWTFTTHSEIDPWYANGDHGYDNEHPLMRAIFIASGPFGSRVRAKVFSERSPIPDLFDRTCPIVHIKPLVHLHDENDESSPVMIRRFENVQVYGLVMQLLGIQRYSSQTNGTAGYWDALFDQDCV